MCHLNAELRHWQHGAAKQATLCRFRAVIWYDCNPMGCWPAGERSFVAPLSGTVRCERNLIEMDRWKSDCLAEHAR
eukprot:353932-Chlamydomonas_euryale.AAC.3